MFYVRPCYEFLHEGMISHWVWAPPGGVKGGVGPVPLGRVHDPPLNRAGG